MQPTTTTIAVVASSSSSSSSLPIHCFSSSLHCCSLHKSSLTLTPISYTEPRTRRRRRSISCSRKPISPSSSSSCSSNTYKSNLNTCDFQPEIGSYIYGTPNPFLLELMFSRLGSINNKERGKTQTPEGKGGGGEEEINKTHRVASTNMWWTNLKSALGQRLNFEGMSSAFAVMTKDRHLALPHLTVQDIRWIDWGEMKRRGFQGVVFDKDNTLTVPYSLTLWPPLSSSLDQCRSVFGDNVVVFSNSAGLRQFDADGSKARALEESIGVHVMRHRVKKPAGKADEFENYFGCETSSLVMVGDRHFTDIVYGNRNGFLTILTEPLSSVEEPFIVRQVRKLEAYLAKRWSKRGLKPITHSLHSEAMQCVKGPSPL